MNLNAIGKPIVIVLVGAVFALGAVGCTSDDGGDGADLGSDGPGTEEQRDVSDATEADATQIFIGLPRDEAAILAESEGRPWRVGLEDGEPQGLDADFHPGRVTFELEQGVVTGAEIEQPLPPPPSGGSDDPVGVLEDNADNAAILAAAVNQILTVDHSFGVDAPPPFDDVRMADALGGAGGFPLAGLQLELIAEAVQDTGATVTFVDDPQALIEESFDSNQIGLAIVTIGSVLVEDERAQVDVGLWCGGLCGVYLTYEVVPAAGGGWEVAGTIGPIALS